MDYLNVRLLWSNFHNWVRASRLSHDAFTASFFCSSIFHPSVYDCLFLYCAFMWLIGLKLKLNRMVEILWLPQLPPFHLPGFYTTAARHILVSSFSSDASASVFVAKPPNKLFCFFYILYELRHISQTSHSQSYHHPLTGEMLFWDLWNITIYSFEVTHFYSSNSLCILPSLSSYPAVRATLKPFFFFFNLFLH